MKKIGILLIALLLMSEGLIGGCLQRPQQAVEKPVVEKHSEFVNWSEEKFNEMANQIQYFYEIVKTGNWSNVLYHVSLIQDTIDNYTKQANDFTLDDGVLDSARNEYIGWLNELKLAYERWESAAENFIAGDTETGTSQAQVAQILMEATKTYVDNYKQDISAWRNEG
ncbi:Uncharacterised protein [uncultured archaeon]|nr:Uncharacterised protein [uncultured archaeon]